MSSNREFVKPPEMPGTHVFEGVKYPSVAPKSNLEAMKTWQVREDDIFCITFPKSGT